MKPKNRKTYDRLMFGLSVMNFWGSLAYFMGQWPLPTIPADAETSPLCTWQGWLVQFNSASFWYYGVLTANFLMRIHLGWPEDRVRKAEPFMHFIAWFYPVVTAFIALGMNMYGPSGPWCWISSKYNWARWAFFYVPLWIIMLFTAVCMVLIVLTVKKSDEQTAHHREGHSSGPSLTGSSTRAKRKKMGKKTRQVAIQAILHVGTFLFTWTFGTAHRLQNAIVVQTPGAVFCNVFALAWLHALCIPSQGFFNFLVYIYPRIVEAKQVKKHREALNDDTTKPRTTFCRKLAKALDEGVYKAFVVALGRERLSRTDSAHGSDHGIHLRSRSSRLSRSQKRNDRESRSGSLHLTQSTPRPHRHGFHDSNTSVKSSLQERAVPLAVEQVSPTSSASTSGQNELVQSDTAATAAATQGEEAQKDLAVI